MAKLRSITNNTLNSLPPATLHKLGVFFTSKGSNFNLAPEPRLETCEVNERKMPRHQELRELYTQYKLEFLREMDKLNAVFTKQCSQEITLREADMLTDELKNQFSESFQDIHEVCVDLEERLGA